MRKLKQLQSNMLEDGTVPQGTYMVEGILKIVEYFWRDDTVMPCVGIKLLPTYKEGDTVTLKRSKKTINFRIVFYEHIIPKKNIQCLNDYIHKLSKVERCNFLSTHAQLVSNVLKEEVTKFYLDTIFEMKIIPDQFEILHKGKRIIRISGSEKEHYRRHPNEYDLISFQEMY